MKKETLTFAMTLLFTAIAFAKSTHGTNQIKQKPGICFTENKGQVHDQNDKARPDVLYGAMAGNLAIHIKSDGVSYQLYRVDQWKDAEVTKSKLKGRKEIAKQTIYRVDLSWLNHNSGFTKTGDGALPGHSNYYLESCPEGALHVKSYKGITLRNLYKGVNLHYYEKNGELKHDYIVAPHADYGQIQLKVEGAVVKVNEDGSLILNTPLGKVQEGAPLVYQNGRQLRSAWRVKNNVLSFEIENHDPAYELIIDPVTRVWGTYYGDGVEDGSNDVCTDSTGNVFMAGSTTSGTSTLIATSGGHQTSYAGNSDAFLAKFSISGTRLWSTYYGGSQAEGGMACAADHQGHVFLAGITSSTGTVLSTPGSHQPVPGSNNGDAFLAKFDANGVRLWATYYGGNSNDEAYGCIADQAGNVYIAGTTSSNNGTTIASPGSHQTTHGTGFSDGYLAKFSPAGVRLWATYYGGSGDENGHSCAVDPNGNVFLAGVGYLPSSGIGTPGSHQPAWAGNQDLYLVKFNSAGVRQWGTYYGGSPTETGGWCGTDASGNVYLSGNVNQSSPAIATTGAHQTIFGGGNSDGFLVKFNAGGVRQWGTFYGGTGADVSSFVITDKFGNIYLSGSTDSGAGIAIPGTHQPSFGGGSTDAYLAKFNSGGVRQWGTYYGGQNLDYSASCAVDTMGHIYLCGGTKTYSGTAVASSGGHQSTGGGGSYDGYLVQFLACNAPAALPASINGPSVTCAGSITAFSTPTVLGVSSHTWSIPAGWTGTTNANAISVTPSSSGVFTVVNGNGCGASPQQTLYLTVNPQPTVTASSGAICAGQSFTISVSGADTYSYSGGPVVSPAATTSYSVSGTSTAGCPSANAAISTVTVHPLPTLSLSTTKAKLCVGETATITASGASTLVFNPGGPGSEITVSPGATGNYTVTGTDANGCSNTAVLTQSVDACLGIDRLAAGSEHWRLYPNPSKGIVNLELDSDTEIIIVNAIGQTVLSVNLNAGIHQINLQHLAKGIYVVKAVDPGNAKAVKMVLE